MFGTSRPCCNAGAVVWILGILATWPTGSSLSALAAQETLSPEHEAISFLVGEWRTTSEFPDGRTGDGELEYRWVFDGGWMKVEFHGDHPDGAMWEAHVMQRWNPEAGSYEAWVFRGGGEPLPHTGTLVEPGHFRVQHTTEEGVTTGIDYHAMDDGSVYQENWVVEEGTRTVTLRTRYRSRR
jgi:hypothetical protein